GIPGEGEDDGDVLAALVGIGHQAEGAGGYRARRQEGGEQGQALAPGRKSKTSVAAEQRDDEDRAELDHVGQVVRLQDQEEEREQDAERGGIAQKAMQRP